MKRGNGDNARALAALMVAVALGVSAPASAGCWSATATSAAQVREFQAMMMAVALRCAANGAPIHESYNGFVRANMDTLNAASATLRRQFANGGGSGQADYDRYTTELSNRYGSGFTSPASCAAFAEIGVRAARTATEAAGLDAFAAQLIPQPHSIGEACPLTTVAASTAAAARGVESASR